MLRNQGFCAKHCETKECFANSRFSFALMTSNIHLANRHSASTGSALWWGFEAIEAAAMTTQRLIDAQRAMVVQSPANSARHFR